MLISILLVVFEKSDFIFNIVIDIKNNDINIISPIGPKIILNSPNESNAFLKLVLIKK